MKRYLLPFILLPLVVSCDPGGFNEPDAPQGTFSFVPSLDTFSSGDMGIQTRSAAVDGLGTLYLKSYDTPFEDSVEPETKTTPVTTLHSSFGASGYIYPALMDDLEGASTPSLFFNTRFDKGYNTYSSEEEIRMPSASYKMRVYAWAPYPTDEQISEKYYYITTAPGDASLPVLHFDSYHCSGIDLLEGVTDLDGDLSNGIQDYPGDNADNKKMVFRHALAGIRFMTKDLGYSGTLNSISLCCYTEGNFSPFGSWTNQSGRRDFDQTLNVTIPATGSSASYNDVLMVIPQTFDETCTLKVSMTLGGKDYKFSVPLDGVTVKKGYITNLILTLTDDALSMISVSPGVIIADAFGTIIRRTVTVTSASIHDTGITKNSSWEIKGYREIYNTKWNGSIIEPMSVAPDILDDYQLKPWSNTCPDWLEINKTSGTGGVDGDDITIEIHGIGSTEALVHVPKDYSQEFFNRKEYLRDLPEVGSPLAAIDLSKNNYLVNEGRYSRIFQSTANCYVVNAPGWYKFPLVYGNAIIDGEANIPSYADVRDQELEFETEIKIASVPTTFQDSWGEYFTESSSPYIADHAAAQGKTLNYARLIKQSLDCSTEVWLKPDEEHGYLYFYIPAEGITEDNLVLAVYDSDGNIAWSWHIWVTAEKESVGLDTEYHTVEFLNRPLGAIEDVYTVRPLKCFYGECDILFVNSDGASYVLKVVSSSITESSPSQAFTPATLYQHGRKDPIFVVQNQYRHNRTTQADCHQIPCEQTGWISDPSNPDAGGDYWCSNPFLNMWGDPGHYSIKTIYDPCPPGWKVPSTTSVVKYFNNDDLNYINNAINSNSLLYNYFYDGNYGFQENTTPGGKGMTINFSEILSKHDSQCTSFILPESDLATIERDRVD